MAAPKNNKFAVGNSGTSKQWETVEDLQKEIDAYFLECTHIEVDELGEDGNKIGTKLIPKSNPIPFTIEGLCETLDCTRHAILNYQKAKGYEEYFTTIARAKMKIQRNKVERGLSGDSNAQVTKFDLSNNHLYVEKSEQEIKLVDEFDSKSDDELQEYIDDAKTNVI